MQQSSRYPDSLQEAKMAWLVTGNGVGLELFEFLEPRSPARTVSQSFEASYNQPGFFHFCVTDSDPEALAAAIEEAGGRRVGKAVDPLGSGVKCVYTADAWGNVIEVFSISFEHLAVAAAAKASGA